ncbi:MAG: ferritin [Putridiphycobacter sp.]|nr:ferritin [Putridiphycobacter sp.]
MSHKAIEKALNLQITKEANSSQLYLSMANWAEQNGLSGISQFLYAHADEERMHMLKLIKFVNERGGKAEIPPINKPKDSFTSIEELFNDLLSHEIMVTNSINEIVHLCIEMKDYTTHNFMQWYVAEQLEEEALARNILDKIKLIGNDKGGLYLLDRDMVNMATTETIN